MDFKVLLFGLFLSQIYGKNFFGEHFVFMVLSFLNNFVEHAGEMNISIVAVA